MLEQESGITALALAGLDLWERGLTPIPVNYKDKTPIVSWGQFIESKPKKYQLRSWFNTDERNVAIIIGKGTGLCVLDVDDPSKYPGDFPVTPTVKTSRGYHLYFKYPESVPIKNMSLPYGDFKADRQLCTVPPSVHKDGTRYEWVLDLSTPLAELPSWLLELATAKIDYNNGLLTPIKTEWSEDQETTAYGARALEDEIETLRNTPEGARNNQYNKSLVKIGSLVSGGQVNLDQALSEFGGVGKEIGLEKDEMIATTKSALTKGLASPRIPTPKAENDNQPVGKLKLKSFVDIEAEPIDWVWTGVLAKGSLSIIAGKPKTGKSQVSLSIAAQVSRGDYFPCSTEKATKGSVIIVSSEDRAEDTIKPRLMALGADMRKIFVLESEDENGNLRPCNLQTDLAELNQIITELGDVQLVIFDVVDSYMGKGDANSNSDVRALCAKLSLLAQKHLLSMLLIRHMRKDDSGDALNTMSGSVAWGGAARANWGVTRHPSNPDLRRMTNMGGNNTKSDEGFEFFIRSKKIGEKEIDTSFVEWVDTKIRMNADEAIADAALGPKIREIVDWLEDRLIPGVGVDYNAIKKEAEALGYSERTLRRARESAGVESSRKHAGKTLWFRPIKRAEAKSA